MIHKLTKIAISAAIPLLIAILSGCSTEAVSKPPDTTASNSVQSTKPSVNSTSGSTVINLKEYINVEFSGYSGSGEAKVSVNYDAMAQLLISGGEEKFGAYATINDIQASSVENSGKLSNGDKVTIKVSYNEKTLENANVTLENTEIEYEVSGLEEKEVLDIFKDVKVVAYPAAIESETDVYTLMVEYSGDVKGYYSDKFNEFTITDKDGNHQNYYKSGDTVKVTISDISVKEYIKMYPQYTFLETSREYVVEYNPDNAD